MLRHRDRFPPHHLLPDLLFILKYYGVQANRGSRQPLPELGVDEAAGAGDPALHSEARDAARSRILSLTLCILSGQGDPCIRIACRNQSPLTHNINELVSVAKHHRMENR